MVISEISLLGVSFGLKGGYKDEFIYHPTTKIVHHLNKTFIFILASTEE